MSRVEIVGLTGIPEIAAGVELAPLVAAALSRAGLSLTATDVLVVTQKIVSKSEGCEVALGSIQPSEKALTWSTAHGKDPRLVELVLREAVRVVRMEHGVIITETRHGFVCANSGVDASNARPGYALTLPPDPDASAVRLRAAFEAATGVAPGVIISDTFGRPWREGLVNVAIGLAGIRPFDDHRGGVDSFGRPLHASVLAAADEVASAAELVMGKTRAIPVALIRGLDLGGSGSARDLRRDPARDLFR
jgi:coenzyme F420-0:L-glutamate ligase / coenzyme F420-1:gamma-L-glutamate ligase